MTDMTAGKAPIRVLHMLQRMETGGTQSMLMGIYRNIDRSRLQFDFLVEYGAPQVHDAEIEALGGRIFRTTFREDHDLARFRHDLDLVLRTHPEYRVLHCHAYTVGNTVLAAAERAGIPTRIAHSHNNQAVRDAKYLPKLVMRALFPRHATDLFACSDAAGRFMFGDRPFTVLRNAIDVDAFRSDPETRQEVRRELGLGDDLVVGHVGRLHAQKNHRLLLASFAELHREEPRSRLLMVGSGPLEAEIRDQVHALGLDAAVTLLQNRTDMPRLYQAMDVFCLPSLFEGLGMVAVEAQAAGVPCVISDKVSEEAVVTSMVAVEPLSSGPESWARAVLDAARDSAAHTDMTALVRAAGYDVRDTARRMQDFYLSRSR